MLPTTAELYHRMGQALTEAQSRSVTEAERAAAEAERAAAEAERADRAEHENRALRARLEAMTAQLLASGVALARSDADKAA